MTSSSRKNTNPKPQKAQVNDYPDSIDTPNIWGISRPFKTETPNITIDDMAYRLANYPFSDYHQNQDRDSAIIEALISGLPLPTPILIQKDDIIINIITGEAYIQAIINFLNDQYSLIGLHILPEFNGRQFSNFHINDQRRLKNLTMRLAIIQADDEYPLLSQLITHMLNKIQ